MQLTTSVAVEAVVPVLYRASSACMLINPFTAKDAIWRPEVITHMVICSTFANKYFYVSKHSMCLF